MAAWQLRAEPGTGPSTGGQRVPFVIGIAGGVPVGMSTLVRLLELLISHWPERHAAELVTTDGFLRPTAERERQGLMSRKGFPVQKS